MKHIKVVGFEGLEVNDVRKSPEEKGFDLHIEVLEDRTEFGPPVPLALIEGGGGGGCGCCGNCCICWTGP